MAAVLAGTLFAGCSWAVEERPTEDRTDGEVTTTTEVETERVEPVLVADAVRLPGGEADVDGEVLTIPAYPGSALLAFALAGVDRACTVSAALHIDQLGEPPRGIEAWVSLEDGLASLADGASLGQSVIARGSPSAPGVPGDGTYRWDVTELVAWSADHQASQTHLVLVLKPTFVDIRSAPPVELGAIEGDRPAALVVAQRTDC